MLIAIFVVLVLIFLVLLLGHRVFAIVLGWVLGLGYLLFAAGSLMNAIENAQPAAPIAGAADQSNVLYAMLAIIVGFAAIGLFFGTLEWVRSRHITRRRLTASTATIVENEAPESRQHFEPERGNPLS